MIKKAAIVAAAGWKGVGQGTGLAHIPAAFLPLGNGTTLLSRLSIQLQDFEIFVGVGPLGYKFKDYQSRVQNTPSRGYLRPIEIVLKNMDLDPEDTPWTRDIYEYAWEWATVLPMPDPGWANPHDTFCRGIDRIGNVWDCVALICGDTLFSTKFLNEILKLPMPCQYQMCPLHSVFLLDHSGVNIYREYTEHRRMRWKDFDERRWIVKNYPDGDAGTGKLKNLGIAHYGIHNGPQGIWYDIDGSGEYDNAKRMVMSGLLT